MKSADASAPLDPSPPERRAKRRARSFDPLAHAEPLAALVDAVAAEPQLDERRLDAILRRHPKDGRGFFSKSELIAGYRSLGAAGRFGVDEASFTARLRLRPVRTLSGVTPVTVLTRPHPCPGRCIFCPSDVRMPKSYVSDEPGAQRAEDNRFDPYAQTCSRLDAYHRIGHPVEKVELIVLGGTWSSYPESYQIWFVTRCLDALADFGRGVDGRGQALVDAGPDERPAFPPPADAIGAYNDRVKTFAGASSRRRETATWDELEAAQRGNETAGARCIGLSLETRPDHVDVAEVRRLRRLGATKIQIGIQSLSDDVLAANRRGHDVATTRRALRLLRGAGFKLHAHFMPNLLGATPESDAAGYAQLFSDPDFRPDELKLYPCLLIETAELARHHARGEWRPYDDAELVALLADCLERTPRYCRVTRVIRDFSSHDIAAGTKVANLREVAERSLAARGGRCEDIRAREIRGAAVEAAQAEEAELEYGTSIGRERFLETRTADDRLLGFLRLALPCGEPPLEELAGCAVIREVHVYGAAQALGRREAGAAQHAGLGRALVERAADAARAAGFERLAVISAVGTRAYYRRLGFEDGELYQVRSLLPPAPA